MIAIRSATFWSLKLWQYDRNNICPSPFFWYSGSTASEWRQTNLGISSIHWNLLHWLVKLRVYEVSHAPVRPSSLWPNRGESGDQFATSGTVECLIFSGTSMSSSRIVSLVVLVPMACATSTSRRVSPPTSLAVFHVAALACSESGAAGTKMPIQSSGHLLRR
jgi:hypothetical protein